MAFPLNVAIASSVRTPVGRAKKGTLKNTRPDDLAAAAVQGALEKVPNLSKDEVEDIILGCAFPEAEQGFNVARNVAFLAGLPETACGQTVNRYCSSGLQSLAMAAMSIQTGLSEVLVAGGVESMSMVPMAGTKPSLNPELVDKYPEAYISMGHTAERVAEKFGISRTDQDTFAVRSHEKALAAIAEGRFKDELVIVNARVFKDGQVIQQPFSVDECPRAGTSIEGVSKLKPVFKVNGTVTAANASPMNDGAAASVLMSDKKIADLGIKPLGRMLAFVVRGVPPDIMGIGPIPAIETLLKMVDLSVKDIDLFEINEAFAAQAVHCQRVLEIPDEKINVNGGGIALGHPLGCTGAKLTSTLLHELKRRNGRYGIVSMCVGGGMGAAGLFEVSK